MSIPTKQNKCKSTGKAKGFESCGELVYRHKYGMCKCCFIKWLLNSSEGEDHIKLNTIQAKKKLKQNEKKAFREKKQKAIVWSDKLQIEINKIVRLIDFGLPCLARGNYAGQFHAGHVISRGANKTIKFNLHNIHRQGAQSNHFQNDDGKLREGLKAEYGDEYMEFITQLQRTPPIKYSNGEYQNFTKDARKLVKLLKAANKAYTLEERIKLRNEMNKELAIYDFEFCEF